jgi:DNA (cytosine-5)-methyltransferase 1
LKERTLNGLALCAGVGGLELGLKLALGEQYRTVCYVEREAYAAATLVARMGKAALDQAPIWDDLTAFDGKPWHDRVDCISAGFPCQPFSVAGSKRGTEDERWLWPDIARIIGEVGPGLVFLENVSGILSHSGGFGQVLGDVATLGFNAEWGMFSAASVGAPHRRERVFILAYPYQRPETNQRQQQERQGDSTGHGRDLAKPILARWPKARIGCDIHARNELEKRGGELADTSQPLHDRAWEAGQSRGAESPNTSLSIMGNAPLESGREPHQNDWGEKCQNTSRKRLVWPPGPNGDWRAVPPSLEPAVCRVANGPASRVDRLRALGNGVVPLVAAHAFRTLAARAGLT